MLESSYVLGRLWGRKRVSDLHEEAVSGDAYRVDQRMRYMPALAMALMPT